MSVTGKFRFLIICQLMLTWFLAIEAFTTEEGLENFSTSPGGVNIVLARFMCAIFLHITLVDKTKQGLAMMKYSMNHPWKFRKWTSAFSVGFGQMFVVTSVEVVNMAILITNNTIIDILMNFLALVIITDFDDYFFWTVEAEEVGKLISEGEYEDDLKMLDANEILKIHVTSSRDSTLQIDENGLRAQLDVILEDSKGLVEDTAVDALEQT